MKEKNKTHKDNQLQPMIPSENSSVCAVPQVYVLHQEAFHSLTHCFSSLVVHSWHVR